MEFRNGVTELDGIPSSKVESIDLLLGMMSDLGASVPSMPANLEFVTYTDKYELMDPEQVENPEDLPPYWKVVYDVHNLPEMRDCRYLGYRYVHSPQEIMCRYPRVPCKGMFVITNRNVSVDEITGDDLIWIGDEIEERMNNE